MKKYGVIVAVGPITTKMTNDIVKDLKEAVIHAHYNLFIRHKIKIDLSSFKNMTNIQ